MHKRNGSDAANRFGNCILGLWRFQPAGLQPQQRRDGLQIVFHTVVNFPNGGVFCEEQAVATAQLRNVAQQQHSPRYFYARERSAKHRNAARKQRHFRGLFNLFNNWFLAFERVASRIFCNAKFGQRLTNGVRAYSGTMQCGNRVRRGVANASCCVEHNCTVTHTRRNAGIGYASIKRKQSFRHHLDELGENFGVRRFELSGFAGVVGNPLARQHGNGGAFERHWHHQHVCRPTNCLNENFSLRNLSGRKALVEQYLFRLARPRVHVIRVIERLSSCSAHLRGD